MSEDPAATTVRANEPIPIPPRLLQRLRTQAVAAQFAEQHIQAMAAAISEPITLFQTTVAAAKESAGLDPQDQQIGLDLVNGVFVVPEAAPTPQPAPVQVPVPDAQP